jgi:hypothetical protein
MGSNDMHWDVIGASRSWRMDQDATRALHRLRGHEKRYHASIRSPAMWLLVCSPIPSSRSDCLDLKSPSYLEAFHMCCRGRDQVADLYLEASGVIRSPSSISRGLLPRAQLSICLFVYLSKDFYPLGNLLSPVRVLLQTVDHRVSGLSRGLPHVSAFLALSSASIWRQRRRKMHMLVRYQKRSSLSWLAEAVVAGIQDGSIRRTAIGHVAEVWPKESCGLACSIH